MSSSEFIVTGSATIKEDKRDLFLAATAIMLSSVRKDLGCIQSYVFEDDTAPNKFFFYEEWQNKAMWMKHLQQPYIAKFIEQTEGLSTEREVRKFTRCDL